MAGMAAERAPRARRAHFLSADSMDRRHGGRVCLRAHPPDAARREATIAACMGKDDHRGIRPLAPLLWLGGSEAMGLTGNGCVHAAVLSEYDQISPLPALPVDDARTHAR